MYSWDSLFRQYSSDFGLTLIFNDEEDDYGGPGIILFKEEDDNYSVVEYYFGTCSSCDELQATDSEEERKALAYAYLGGRVPLDKWFQNLNAEDGFLFNNMADVQQHLISFLKEHNLWTL